MSSSRDSPLLKYYGNILKVEIFNKSSEELDTFDLSLNNRWKNYTKETCESGYLTSKICVKLMRGNVNYVLMLEEILGHLLSFLDSDIGSISLVSDVQNSDQENFLLCIALGEKNPGTFDSFYKKISIEKSPLQKTKKIQGIFHYSISNDKVIISNDILSDPRFENNLPEGHPPIKNFLALPIKYQNCIIGLLSISNKKDGYLLNSFEYIIPLLDVITHLLIKSADSKDTLASKFKDEDQVEKAKDRFLATMSHELRTPLNGIMGMVTLLPDAGPTNHKQKEYLKNLTECTVKLSNLLNNILDFSKMAADKLVLQSQPFSILDAAGDSVKITEGNILAKGIELIVDIPKNIPRLIGDHQRLMQILSNLLVNAGKFTDKGFIKLKVETELIDKNISNSSKKWKITFIIQDTGMGIPSEEQEKIFEMFNQSSNLSTYQSRNGTGLGLSIARELVRLMNGKISVFSEGIPEKGSIFKFYIILEEEINVRLLNKDDALLLTGSHILIVDDRPEMRIQLSDMMFKWKCIPQAVSSAEEALQYLQYGMKFKVALVDIHMPGMTGIELAQELRLRYPKLPLIGISSGELSGSEDYFDFYMYKPIDQSTLFPALLNCISKSGKKGKLSSSYRKRKSKRNLKILVAEDDSYNRYTIKELLKNLGYSKKNILLVNDGLECVQEVKKNEYDVILMDIIMPKMDGIQASKIIKKELSISSPMIIAVSAAVQPSDKSKCQHAGIDGYLAKPIDKDKLESSLKPLIKKSTSKKSRNESKKDIKSSKKNLEILS